MKELNSEEKRRGHPYLSGNFAPIQQVLPLTPCSYTGTIPEELAGGEYVRNGGNPVTNDALGRDAHWFDGDGMLSGVSFRRTGGKGAIQPEFVNQYILTDVYNSSKTSSSLTTPILPSIATLVNPMSSLITIILRIFRTITLVILSHLPGSQQAIERISVANTSILYHDGRALATCESGPPMRIALPGLETIGWFNGKASEGEYGRDTNPGFGGKGPFSFMREWTTAHPRVDHKTKELILYHSTFVPPYVNYSIVSSTYSPAHKNSSQLPSNLVNRPVPGIGSAKMMHDFGVSSTHTIIMDLPLSLDPLNLARNKPVVAYDPTSRSRFGVFPRHRPQDVRWFETNPCCIFHTANSWNSTNPRSENGFPGLEMVNLLACRLTSASLVFSAGDLAAPTPTHDIPADQQEEEQCRLYYYQFCLPHSSDTANPLSGNNNLIAHQWALSAIPFEFPSLRDSVSMAAAKYIYGCSVSGTSFGAALGRAVKINSLVKMDVETLIKRGIRDLPAQIFGCVDTRDMSEVLASQDPLDPIKVFKMPEGWYAQESRFVSRTDGGSEDDGWILSYVFDESQLLEDDECRSDAKSELWIIDAKTMTDVVARVHLPQRVPYGLHGSWFSEEDIQGQRPVERLRTLPRKEAKEKIVSQAWGAWMATRKVIERWLK
ncbi:MAG: hypothetical protein Q9161_009429 [Pseudevernia consocians]